MNKRMYGRYGDWVVPGNNVVTPQYNTNLVSTDEAPKSWEDLLDPKWKGQIGMTPSGIRHWAGFAVIDGGWGMEKTEDFLRKLREQDLIWARGNSAAHTLLIAGEFQVSAIGYHYHVLQSRRKGAPVEWVRVDPVLLVGSSFLKIKNGPNPNASRLWLEWLFSPQGLLTWDKVTFKGAAFPGAGTEQAIALEGLNLVYRSEANMIKIVDMGLMDRFAKILGVTN